MTTHRSVLPSRLVSFADTHPVAAFYTLTLVFSWTLWVPLFVTVDRVTQLHAIPGAFGPAAAAALLVWLRGGSVRAWLRDGLDWRVGRRWYAVAVGLPVVLGVAMGLLLVAVAGEFTTARLGRVAVSYPLVLLFTTLLGGGQEEFGWRGFALPALQRRFDALTASVGIGVGWAGWHLPLFVFDVGGYGSLSFPLYALLVVGFAVIFTWLYNSTGGSVLLAMVLHGGINAASNLGGAFVGDPTALGVPILLAYVVPVWVVAAGLLVRYGRATLAAESAVAPPSATDSRTPA